MQILTATELQMVHPLSTIFAYSFQRFGRYLTNKCFNVSSSQKESKGVKSCDLDGQLTGPEREIKCSPKFNYIVRIAASVDQLN